MWGDCGANVSTQMLSMKIRAHRVLSYPTIFALFHPQRSLQMQLSNLLWWRSSHGSHQVEAVELLEDLKGNKSRVWSWIVHQVSCLAENFRCLKEQEPVLIGSYLLHFFTAALYSLVGLYAGRNGGQLLFFLTLAHLGLHTVDKTFYCCHLEEENHRNTLNVQISGYEC